MQNHRTDPGAEPSASAAEQQQPVPPLKRHSATAVVAVGVVAAASAVISYGHVWHLSREVGETPLSAVLLPIALDGGIAAAVAVIMNDSRLGRRPTMLTWLLLGLGLVGSLAANVASAAPTLEARVVAGWPPLMLAVGIEVLAQMIRRGAREHTVPLLAATGPGLPAAEDHGSAARAVLTATVPPLVRATAVPMTMHNVGEWATGSDGSAPGLSPRTSQDRGAAPGGRVRLGSPDLTATGAELRPLVPLPDRVAELVRNWDPSQVTGPKVAEALQISDSYARRMIRENRMSEAAPLRAVAVR
jgi:hypothetical protein